MGPYGYNTVSDCREGIPWVWVLGRGVPATGSPSTTVFRLTYPPHLRTVTTVLRCPHSCPAGHSWVSVSREVPTRTGWRYRGGPRRGQQGTGVVGVPGVHVPVIYIGHPHTGIPLGMWSDTVSPPPHPTYRCPKDSFGAYLTLELQGVTRRV